MGLMGAARIGDLGADRLWRAGDRLGTARERRAGDEAAVAPSRPRLSHPVAP
jgi:hypothetical protein